MRCVMCGRRLLKAAATVPAQPSGLTPYPAGAVGPVCARRAGLIVRKLGTKRRVAIRSPWLRAKRANAQQDWVGAIGDAA